VREFRHPARRLFSRSQGSIQSLPGGNVFLSWGGSNPYLTEFTPDGRPVLEAHFLPSSDDTYRAYRQPWKGRPTSRPAVAAVRRGKRSAVYVSWNGATDVAGWEVLAGRNARSLRPVASAPWRDFETKLSLSSAPRRVAVRARDKSGAVIGVSAVVRPRRAR
jgi:hypothetical protein